ncbi:cyclic GMP-AMP synthase DncV-like nucleotidyltransferase [Mesorhizobium sp.]|uniref:SMODS domain-containing nucleotidyltransferase n=1 Tax=Mesorhizobium sp. TaxID=1871066 RepID=UPI0011FA1219|nr:nucleotidyltransferase [Mesorhizobium sp.]TIS37529.1 MAG: nucleotidyltransferase [Mesorhizobium sp.]
MKHVDLFRDFLEEEVNLNQTRVDSLAASVEAIKKFVASSDWAPNIARWVGQGSWAHQTIIKPVDNGEFDADLLVMVSHVEGWEPKNYIDELYWVFKNSSTYKDMVRRWSHCVTITYSNDKKIDVAPCVINRSYVGSKEVCNRDSNEFENSAPEEYTAWLIQRNTWSGSNSFRKVTRLIKYLRDIKSTFKCTSILLTTLLGERVSSLDQNAAGLADTPTALKTIFGRLDDWLLARDSKPAVNNPCLYGEDFASDLTDDQYSNLRTVIHRYRGWIDDAFDEADRSESIGKWQRVFGEAFAKDVVLEEAVEVAKTAAASARQVFGVLADTSGDMISLLGRFGAQVIPRGIRNLPHMRRPKWQVASSPTMSVVVKAELYASRGYNKLADINSLDILAPGRWLQFRATTANGLPLVGEEYDVQWRITNTDRVARERNQLRGEFYESSTRGYRWEKLEYRGVHVAEAFVIRKRGNIQVGKSEPFLVAIE